MTDDLTARLRVTYAAHVPDPDQDDDAPFDILASEMVDLTALLLEAAEAIIAERQARDQAEQERDRLLARIERVRDILNGER